MCTSDRVYKTREHRALRFPIGGAYGPRFIPWCIMGVLYATYATAWVRSVCAIGARIEDVLTLRACERFPHGLVFLPTSRQIPPPALGDTVYFISTSDSHFFSLLRKKPTLTPTFHVADLLCSHCKQG